MHTKEGREGGRKGRKDVPVADPQAGNRHAHKAVEELRRDELLLLKGREGGREGGYIKLMKSIICGTVMACAQEKKKQRKKNEQRRRRSKRTSREEQGVTVRMCVCGALCVCVKEKKKRVRRSELVSGKVDE